MEIKEKSKRITESIMHGSSGTDHYYKHMGPIMLSDGSKAVAETGQCYWLMDILASYMMTGGVPKDSLVIWRVYRTLKEGQTMDQRLRAGFGPVKVTAAHDWDKDMPIDQYVMQEVLASNIDFDGPYLQMYSRENVIFMPSEN